MPNHHLTDFFFKIDSPSHTSSEEDKPWYGEWSFAQQMEWVDVLPTVECVYSHLYEDENYQMVTKNGLNKGQLQSQVTNGYN